MREKYIEERIPRWFIFGRHVDGCVDISDGERDVLTHVPEPTAFAVIALREAFVDEMVAYWMERPEEWLRRNANCSKCGHPRIP